MDINQDNSRKCKISEDSMDSTEQIVSTATCRIGKDAGATEDLSSQTHGEMDLKELTTEKSRSVCKSEIAEKDIVTVTSLTDSRETLKEPKYFTQNQHKDESFEKTIDEDSSETSPRDCDSYASPRTEHKALGPEVENKFKRNLEKFLEDETSWKENRCHNKTKMSDKVIKSDGEIAKIANYCGSLKRISSVLSMINIGPSSAPPTFNMESKQSPQINILLSTSFKGENNDSNVMHESIKINLENQKTPVSVKTADSLSIKTPESTLGESSGLFKVPTVPTSTETMLQETPESNSPGTSKIEDSAATPVLKRPKDFNVKTRKAFYTFSPHPTGVLRQCMSLPNINRPPRKQEKHRRSLILDENPRIVRSLFGDEPEPSTPKTKESAVPEGNLSGSTLAGSPKQESERCSRSTVSHSKETDRKSKTCRKLCFTLPAYDETRKVQPAEEAKEVVKGKPESPLKRKEISPQLVQSSSTSVKKVRISPELKRSEDDTCHKNMENIHSASGEGSKDYLTPSFSPGKKTSPLKRKALEGTDSSKTNVSPSKSPMKRKALEVGEDAVSSKTKVSPSKIVSRPFL